MPVARYLWILSCSAIALPDTEERASMLILFLQEQVSTPSDGSSSIDLPTGSAIIGEAVGVVIGVRFLALRCLRTQAGSIFARKIPRSGRWNRRICTSFCTFSQTSSRPRAGVS
jgi:hypothetical protein